jgi:hypothetical protein
MHYSLFVMSREATEAEIGEEAMAWGREAFDSYAKELDAAGVLVSANILQPVAAATTVSVRDGTLKVHDGPFADATERLNGTFVINVAHMDAAVAWAQKCPGAQYGEVEIRPLAIVFTDGAWRPAE